MPIHTSWKSMLQSMKKTYSGQGDTRCYDMTDETEFCASSKAWSVFFAKVTEDYGKGAETRPKSRTVNESTESKAEKPSDLEIDIFIDWYLGLTDLEEKKKDDKDN